MANIFRGLYTYANKIIPDPIKDLILLAMAVDVASSYAVANARNNLKEDATKAGFDDVGNYIRYSAYRYQECVAEKGSENPMCKAYKDIWLESTKTQYGIKLDWNEEVRKMLKKDATQAGYKKKDGMFQKAIRSYEKCVATFGTEYSRCMVFKKYWMARKAAQNGVGGFAGEKGW